jgi:hypothetical protein
MAKVQMSVPKGTPDDSTHVGWTRVESDGTPIDPAVQLRVKNGLVDVDEALVEEATTHGYKLLPQEPSAITESPATEPPPDVPHAAAESAQPAHDAVAAKIAEDARTPSRRDAKG